MANITLKRAMNIVKNGEAWTIATEYGNGWIYYFDGKELHDGSYNRSLEDLLDRECIQIYERPERKHWSKEDEKAYPYMELESGLAFIITGKENGKI